MAINVLHRTIMMLETLLKNLDWYTLFARWYMLLEQK